MSTLALLDVTTHVDGHDFTGDTNSAQLTLEAAQLNATAFASGGSTVLKGGLKTSTFNMEGFFQSAASDAVDPEAFPNLGVRNRVHTMIPEGSETDTAYLWRAGHFSYQLLGTLGEMAPFTLGSMGTDGVGAARGQLAVAKADVSSTGAVGSPVNLGAGSSGERLFWTLHVFGVGTSISLKVESDDAQGFGSPTDVTGATLGPISARGGSWLTPIDASSITDSWFRVNVTAITGTFNIASALAIQ